MARDLDEIIEGLTPEEEEQLKQRLVATAIRWMR
jgi:hypothetical protein